MSYAAYYQCDGEMTYKIAVRKLEPQASFEIDKFLQRMYAHGEPCELYWVWTTRVVEGLTS